MRKVRVRKTKSRKGKIWTERELALLKKLFPTMSTALLAIKLGRSVAALRAKAKRVGLKKKPIGQIKKKKTKAKPRTLTKKKATSKKSTRRTDDSGPKRRNRRKPVKRDKR